MGVLQRLEKDAREARERRAAESGAREQRDAAARSRLEPALDAAARYLETMCAHLGELDEAIHAHYRLDGIGEFAGLRQASYRTVRGDDGSSVQLRFECGGPNPLEAMVEGHARAEARARELRDAGLGCHVSPVSSKVMRLRVEPKVPVRVTLVPAPEQGQIVLELRNLAAIGNERFPLPPERIDEELLDAVASLVLREPSRLRELTGSVLDDGDRADLKRRLAREGRRREAELAGGLRRRLFPLAEWFRRQFLSG